MAEPTVFIVNPASGGGRTGRRWPAWRRVLRDHGVEVEERLTRAPGEATELVREAIGAGAGRVVAVGGDGTLNEAVNGYLDPHTSLPRNGGAVLGLFPSGTGGDFRRTLGIPGDARACARLLITGSERRIDAGRIDYGGWGARPRHFVNIADCGVGGEVAARVNRGRHVGSGTARFLYHSLAALFNYDARPVRVEVDGEVLAGRAQSVVIANGRYFGGGMCIAPGARVDDGLFDVVLIGARSRRATLLDIRRIYNGSHIDRPGVAHRRGRRVAVIPLSEAPLLFDVEGEQIGQAPATLTCLPGVLRFAAPAVPVSATAPRPERTP